MAGPVLENVDASAGPGAALLRQRLLRFMIVMAKDQEMRAPLAEQAAARIGLDGEADVNAAPASELETILSVGVQDLGEPFFDLLLEQAIGSEDPQFRNAAAGALARVEDPALVAKLQDAVLAEDFKGVEGLTIVMRQMARSATTDLTHAWLVENFDTLVERIPQTFRSNVVPGFGGSFCSEERAVEWQAFVEANGDRVPGYERDLAQVTEGIRLCAALRESSGDDLATAFAEFAD